MQLTQAQQTTFKTDINSVANAAALGAFVAASDWPSVAIFYNNIATPDFFVWHTAVRVDGIFDAILWANFTPADAPDGTVAWTNRSLACQGKQFNLQTMLQGRITVDAARPNWRIGLQDALTALPSGVAGASRSGGWAAVQLLLSRKATILEKLFAIGVGTIASPAFMNLEGLLNPSDVQQAMLYG